MIDRRFDGPLTMKGLLLCNKILRDNHIPNPVAWQLQSNGWQLQPVGYRIRDLRIMWHEEYY